MRSALRMISTHSDVKDRQNFLRIRKLDLDVTLWVSEDLELAVILEPITSSIGRGGLLTYAICLSADLSSPVHV